MHTHNTKVCAWMYSFFDHSFFVSSYDVYSVQIIILLYIRIKSNAFTRETKYPLTEVWTECDRHDNRVPDNHRTGCGDLVTEILNDVTR